MNGMTGMTVIFTMAIGSGMSEGISGMPIGNSEIGGMVTSILMLAIGSTDLAGRGKVRKR